MKSSNNNNKSNTSQTIPSHHTMRYMPGLDGMRALAVFAVVTYHLDLKWAQGGLLGVNLFFVLSGFLITNILLYQWEEKGRIDLKDFWIRRARRLLPALFLMLSSVFSWVIIFDSSRLAALKGEVLAAIFYVSNWHLILKEVSYFESFGPPSPLGHLWSLAIEEQFYILWPVLLGLTLRYLIKRKRVIGGTIIVILVSVAAMALIYVPGMDPSRVYYGTDTRAFALLIGALLAMVWPSWKMDVQLSSKKRLALDAIGSLGFLVVILMMIKTNQYQTFVYQGGLLIFSVAAALFVAALAHPSSHLAKLFSWRPLRWIGESSYGIYLWHYPVIVLTSPIVNTGGADPVRIFWQMAITVILAALSRYLIEEPLRYGLKKQYLKEMFTIQKWQKPLKAGLKGFVSIALIFLILFVTANQGSQSSASQLTEKDYVAEETEQRNNHHQETENHDEEIENQDQEDKDQLIGNEDNQPNLPEGSEDPDGSEGTVPPQIPDNPVDDMVHGLIGEEITVIGDSLMIDVEPVLQRRIPGIIVDAKVSRQMHQAPDIIDQLKREGKLKKTVIIELGTNGSFTEKQLKRTLDDLNEADKIILINTRVPRPWEQVVNETLKKVSDTYINTTLIDWYSVSSGKDDYFSQDGVHLNKTGAEAYANTIIEALTSSR